MKMHMTIQETLQLIVDYYTLSTNDFENKYPIRPAEDRLAPCYLTYVKRHLVTMEPSLDEEHGIVQLNFAWSITLNPAGSGLMLQVNRGISCENHTQCVTVHTTNTPDLKTVFQVVQENKQIISSQINTFVDFITTFPYSDSHDEFKETIGILFQRHLLEWIARKAESLENAKH